MAMKSFTKHLEKENNERRREREKRKGEVFVNAICIGKYDL